MLDWFTSIRLPEWVDLFLWGTGLILGFGGSVVIVNLLPDTPPARIDAKRMEGYGLVPDLQAIQEHNALYKRRWDHIKVWLILSCGGFCILFIQIYGHC